jgi:hypothetical protein
MADVKPQALTSTYNPPALAHPAALVIPQAVAGIGTANLASYARIRPAANVTITTLRAYIGSGVTAEVGIYSSTGSGSSARPSTKLVSATTASGTGGLLDTTISGTALTAGTDYWLGITGTSTFSYFVCPVGNVDLCDTGMQSGQSSLPTTASASIIQSSVPLIKALS